MELLKQGLRKNINNGLDTDIWQDRWIPNNPSFKVTTVMPLEDSKPVKVAELIDHSSGIWNKEKLEAWFNEKDRTEILKIAIGTNNEKDNTIWHFTRDGEYYAKSGYYYLLNSENDDRRPSSSRDNSIAVEEGWKNLWKLNAMPNVKNFIWKSCHNALATNENLHRLFKNKELACRRCGKEDETIEHILFFCNFARATWAASGYSYKPRIEGFGSIKQWWDSISSNCPSFGSFCSNSLIAYLLWQLWKERNDMVFEGKSNDPITTWNVALANYTKFHQHLEERRSNGSTGVRSGSTAAVWTPPKEGFFKINCDASCNKTTGEFGIAAIVSNHEGKIIDAAADCINACSIESPEAQAIRLAMRLAKEKDYDPIVVESDCKNVINRLKIGSSERAWETAAIEKDIKMLGDERMYVKFCFIGRNGNSVADAAAKRARNDTCILPWVIDNYM